ncbi:adenylate/guanylate cyclase domain-containing protein [Pyxidicoccus fallax]|uniref:Adenylate/guanylate cyclase domain-containing protein n=1 Tax=Pyxidicoccus fallax TaxID=394095 RepID=A0A848LL75_9BACT|nr:adenylate/guanylate cyclase domain-containing protein [Pyxidicoccus fallax]NMO18486.1 adenylate/guanylate cyclase domain-containing protein [Pyxidicoccus fallax]NPC81351.1 adenylate/guanylate cyclase domain-containing protein [Pyxidicoccus fallax]
MAVLFGCVLGLLVYLRAPGLAEPRDESSGWGLAAAFDGAQAILDGWERASYDWRVRELGERSERPDEAVVVAIDDETLAEARQDDRPGVATQPWPRQLVGGMVNRLTQEGALLVLVDLPFPELSPSACVDPKLSPQPQLAPSDDAAFRQLLDREPNRALLAFTWESQGPRVLPPASRLWPYRVKLGTYATPADARTRVQAVLAVQRPAFLIPTGNQVEVWGGATDEADARALGGRLGVGSAAIEERRAADDAYRVGPTDLFVALSEVQVEGLDSSKLVEVRHLQHPVAPLLRGSGGFGAVSLPADPDGVVRAIPHLVAFTVRGQRHVLPSLPLAAAMRLAGTTRLRYADGKLHIGDEHAIPMDASGFSLVRWNAPTAGRGSRGSLARSIRAWNVLLNVFDVAEERPARFDNDLEGRTVVLTRTAGDGGHMHRTPIGGETPGGAILGQALANILRSDGITRATPDTDLMLTMGLAFVGAFLALSLSFLLRSVRGAVLYVGMLVAAGAGYAAAAAYVFIEQHLWIAMAGPLLAMVGAFGVTILYAFSTEREVRDFVHNALGRYVSPEVARLVTRDLNLMRPERRNMSVYICDIEGFTRLSEGMAPEQLVGLFNEYLTEMTAVVRSTAGQVDKYIGDSVMAFWGAPVRTDRHAHLACEAALKLRAALASRQDAWEKKYGRRLSFRAGIDTGEVVVGDMGSELKSNYTVLGDAVGLAARLESINKVYGTYVLVGDATAKLASDVYVFRVVDQVRLKGRPQPVRVHELVGRRGEITPRAQEQLSLYEQGLTAYHQRRFAEAHAAFERVATDFQDSVAAVYVARCARFLVTPPPADWDGVHGLEESGPTAAAA